ncbi:MAG TPA: hypothetical protein VMX17_07665 [Candidatus Glassbacteria bacterium]|nr:hypothetical protein [Candidatus Glassbacteria bacterium]
MYEKEYDRNILTLDEAIEHALEVAKKLRAEGKHCCADDHLCLYEWLKELKERRDKNGW